MVDLPQDLYFSYDHNCTRALIGYFLVMTGHHLLVLTGCFWLGVQGMYNLCLT